jgi:hypothetical protein
MAPAASSLCTEVGLELMFEITNILLPKLDLDSVIKCGNKNTYISW